MDVKQAANGRWFEILTAIGGISADVLQDKHGPCPFCGGKDRWRWDDLEGNGGGFCNQCGSPGGGGGHLSGFDILMRSRNWEFKQAAAAVEEHLGLRKPRPTPPTAGAERFWTYTPDFLVVRFPAPPKKGSTKPGKSVRPLIWDGNKWDWKSPRRPRPIYWARRQQGAEVIITEGEPAADAAARLFPSHAVVTWAGGTPNVDKADWSGLAGRTVILWPDNDDPGRQAMQTLAEILAGQGCTVLIADYPADSVPPGWDLADANGWSPESAAASMARVLRPITAAPPPVQLLEVQPADNDPSPPAASGGDGGGQPFACLGLDDAGYYYQTSETGLVTRIGGSSHSPLNLLRLAGIEYWRTAFPSPSVQNQGVDWTSAANTLFRQQAIVGIFDPSRIRGRGAWIDDDRVVLNLGDSLLMDGARYPVTDLPDSNYVYQRHPRIPFDETIEPLTDVEGCRISAIAESFLWETPVSGLLLAGWTTLAPLCGALEWRPHVWLTATSGSGKSSLFDRFLRPLVGRDFGLWAAGSSTEAYLRQKLNSDARPIAIEEFEGNESSDRTRVQEVLNLARVASSSREGEVIGRGGAAGVPSDYSIRSMFLVCSINVGLKQGADKSRFAQLTLLEPARRFSDPADRSQHWDGLRSELKQHINSSTGQRLLARNIKLLPVILEAISVFRDAAAEHLSSRRLGDQYGTLMAGAWCLTCSTVPTTQEAMAMIKAQDWSHCLEAVEFRDEQQCLETILQHQLRVEMKKEGVVTRTIRELVLLVGHRSADVDVTVDTADNLLQRHGLRVSAFQYGARKSDVTDCLLISNTAQGIKRILAQTPWATCWPKTIRAHHNTFASSKSTRFRGSGVAYSTVVPLDVIDPTIEAEAA